jgi:formyl-CoA transferase
MSEGVTARLKVDYEHLRQANSRIIYASIKAFGEPSAYPNLKGTGHHRAGLERAHGGHRLCRRSPTRVGLPISDLVTPLFAVNGILSALIHRGRTAKAST